MIQSSQTCVELVRFEARAMCEASPDRWAAKAVDEAIICDDEAIICVDEAIICDDETGCAGAHGGAAS